MVCMFSPNFICSYDLFNVLCGFHQLTHKFFSWSIYSPCWPRRLFVCLKGSIQNWLKTSNVAGSEIVLTLCACLRCALLNILEHLVLLLWMTRWEVDSICVAFMSYMTYFIPTNCYYLYTSHVRICIQCVCTNPQVRILVNIPFMLSHPS